ncbi:hypothetical protein [Dermabacter hominis]|uniref:hypothetical protein n=1 Tax=Dermabacter hominis TaxID=36740 RepID=UPI0021A53053|nr:hypothetical protein [Dermabacter hominis]MCT1790643.1 hypothetical protein [Dermabacter hominis]
MTLTFKNAKYAIDEYGGAFRVVRIVENFDDLTERPNGVVTRAEAEDIGEYDPDFKPCVVVTTAREALDAAWELAHEPEDGVIPANAGYIRLRRSDGKFYLSHLGPAIDANDGRNKRRLLDPPEPEAKSEPWEESRFCYAAGMFFERGEEGDGPYWVGGDCCPQRYEREDMAELNPAPVTIEHPGTKEEA